MVIKDLPLYHSNLNQLRLLGFSRKKPWTPCWGYQNFQRLPPRISRRKRVTPSDFQPIFPLYPLGFPTFSSHFCLIPTDFHSFSSNFGIPPWKSIIILDVTPSDRKLISSTGGPRFFSGKAQSNSHNFDRFIVQLVQSKNGFYKFDSIVIAKN